MILYSQGDALLTLEELQWHSEAIASFHADALARKTPRPVTFTGGRLDADTVNINRAALTGGIPDWKPIGPGKPLTVRVEEIYTGKHPAAGIFGRKSDVLITSAVKSYATFDAQPRALNFIRKDATAKTRFTDGDPSEIGTPIVYYSPALLDRSLTVGLTMVADEFDSEIINTIGSAFTNVAGIPIFLAHSSYLLAAGSLIKLIGQAGENLFDGSPFFNQSERVDIDLPGRRSWEAGYVLISASDAFEAEYKVDDGGQVVNRTTGARYDGDNAYVVLSLDGAEDAALKNFTPTAASAELLSRFLGAENKQAKIIDSIVEGVKLSNDYRFRKRVDAIDAQLARANLPQDERDSLTRERAALVKNILNEVLRP